MINIYCSPLGVSLRDKFIEQITTANLPYGQELLLLPSNFLMQEVRQKAIVKVSSFDSLVLAILDCVAKQKIPSMNRFAQELLLTSIIDELVANKELKYFTPICQTKSFLKNILASIGDFMRAGVTSTELSELLRQADDNDTNHSGKTDDLLLIFSKYHERLQSHRVLDLELSYQLVVRLLQMYKTQEVEEIVLPWKKIYISDFYHFSSLQLEIIKLLEYYCPVEINLVYEKNKARLYIPTKHSLEFLQGLPKTTIQFSSGTISRSPELQFLCENLIADSIADNSLGINESIKITSYKTREQEMRVVIADIKKKMLSGASYREFLIIVRNVKNYSALRDCSHDAGVSISLGKNIALRQTALYRLMINFLQIKSFVASKEIIVGFYTSPLFKRINALPIELLEKNFYEAKVSSYSSIKDLKIYETFENIHREFFQELLQRLDNIPAKYSPSKYIELLREFLEFLDLGNVLGQGYQDGELSIDYLKSTLLAEEMLENCLLEMQKTYELLGRDDKNISLQDFIVDFFEQSNNKELVLEAGNQKGIRVVSASDVQGVNAPFVYLLGLTEGEFPEFAKENWLLTEPEKFSLGLVDFPTLSLAVAEDNYFFATACAAATKKLFLSGVPDERSALSNYLTKINQLFTNENKDKLLKTEKLVDELPTLENIFDQKTLLKYCASQITDSPDNDFLQKVLTDHLGTDFLQKYSLDEERKLGKNIYNGQLKLADILQAMQTLVGKKFSASNLEIYARCPFRYLAGKVWQVEDWEKIDDFGDNRTLGTLYHNVLARFLQKYISQNLSKFVTIDLVAELKEIWQQEQENLLSQEDGFVGNMSVLLGEETWLRLEKWLYKEIYWQKNAHQNILPVLLEQEFEFKINDIIIEGRIDRIDGNGNYFVVLDYKSNSHPTKKELLEGYDLQIPIYLLGTSELIAKKTIHCAEHSQVIGGTYFSLKKGLHGDGWWDECAKKQIPYAANAIKELPFLEDLRSQTEEFISTYIENIYNGAFAPRENSKCNYCAVQNICRKTSEILENGDDD